MKTYFIAGTMIRADDCVRGIFINPSLPFGFSNTANESRPFEHMIWWMQPYIAGFDNEDEGRCSVYCLDGGAWDRPTWRGDFDSLAQAIDAAREIRARGNHMISEATLLPGTTSSYGMTPLKFD